MTQRRHAIGKRSRIAIWNIRIVAIRTYRDNTNLSSIFLRANES
ncbi:hypothetical protein [Xanthomonas theicola]|nr:hypothetical protein [Xanthomonas theicola]